MLANNSPSTTANTWTTCMDWRRDKRDRGFAGHHSHCSPNYIDHSMGALIGVQINSTNSTLCLYEVVKSLELLTSCHFYMTGRKMTTVSVTAAASPQERCWAVKSFWHSVHTGHFKTPNTFFWRHNTPRRTSYQN